MNSEQCVIMLILMRQEWQVAIAVADDIWSIKGDCWPERIAQSTGMHELRYCFVIIIIIIIIQFIKRLRRGFRGTGGRPIVGVNQKTTWSMVIVGRMREKIIKTVLLCTHWCAYTYEQFLQITAGLGFVFGIFFNYGQLLCITFASFEYFFWFSWVVIAGAVDCLVRLISEYDIKCYSLTHSHFVILWCSFLRVSLSICLCLHYIRCNLTLHWFC